MSLPQCRWHPPPEDRQTAHGTANSAAPRSAELQSEAERRAQRAEAQPRREQCLGGSFVSRWQSSRHSEAGGRGLRGLWSETPRKRGSQCDSPDGRARGVRCVPRCLSGRTRLPQGSVCISSVLPRTASSGQGKVREGDILSEPRGRR